MNQQEVFQITLNPESFTVEFTEDDVRPEVVLEGELVTREDSQTEYASLESHSEIPEEEVTINAIEAVTAVRNSVRASLPEGQRAIEAKEKIIKDVRADAVIIENGLHKERLARINELTEQILQPIRDMHRFNEYLTETADELLKEYDNILRQLSNSDTEIQPLADRYESLINDITSLKIDMAAYEAVRQQEHEEELKEIVSTSTELVLVNTDKRIVDFNDVYRQQMMPKTTEEVKETIKSKIADVQAQLEDLEPKVDEVIRKLNIERATRAARSNKLQSNITRMQEYLNHLNIFLANVDQFAGQQKETMKEKLDEMPEIEPDEILLSVMALVTGETPDSEFVINVDVKRHFEELEKTREAQKRAPKAKHETPEQFAGIKEMQETAEPMFGDVVADIAKTTVEGASAVGNAAVSGLFRVVDKLSKVRKTEPSKPSTDVVRTSEDELNKQFVKQLRGKQWQEAQALTTRKSPTHRK